MIRKFREQDRQILKDITTICFDGVSIDQNIEKTFGKIAGRAWQDRKVLHIDDDIAANADGILVYEEDGKVIGYITTRINKYSNIGWIPNMAVLPGYQGRGIGKALIQAALEYLRQEGMEYAKIETLDQNKIGESLYPKMGFREVARQIHYVMPLK